MKNDCLNIAAAGETNAGLLRRVNEDCFLICRPCGGKKLLAVVSDGIGGHSDGEIASMICCRDMMDAAMGDLRENDDPQEFLLRTLESINSKLFERNYREERLHPMGCTVVAALFDAERIVIANIGDSRFYQFVPGEVPELQQITRDHRPKEKVLEGLALKYRVSKEILRSRVLQCALGTRHDIQADFYFSGVLPGASYLLCSDGLHGRTPDVAISRCLNTPERSVRERTSALVREALLYGGRDNVTVITVQYVNGENNNAAS